MRMGTHSRADVLTERLGAIQPVKAGAATAGPPSGAGSLPATLDIASGNVPRSSVELGNLARATLRAPTGSCTGTARCRATATRPWSGPGDPSTVSGAGHLLDGLWYVQGVRHRWGVDPADPEREQRVRRYEADVTVVRNALGGVA